MGEQSKHPELHILMDNLYQAGMSIEQVIEHGFDFAKYLRSDATVPRLLAHPQAAQIVHDVADELGISRMYHLKVAGEIIALHSRKRQEPTPT